MAFKVSKAASRAAYERQQAAMAASRADTTRRLVEAYRTETDRDYAEAFYGEMLAERGVDVSAL